MSISLSKNQSVSLQKESGSSVTNIHVGLGWDAAKPKGFFGKIFGGGGSIDLDASCIMLDSSGAVVDTVWFRQLKSKCGSVVHSGDNRTGDGDGDDEIILIDLGKVPQNVKYLAFTVNSFTGQTFNDIDNAGVRVLDQNNKLLVTYNLAERGAHRGLFIASLERIDGDWSFKAHGTTVAQGQTFQNLLPVVQRELVG